MRLRLKRGTLKKTQDDANAYRNAPDPNKTKAALRLRAVHCDEAASGGGGRGPRR